MRDNRFNRSSHAGGLVTVLFAAGVACMSTAVALLQATGGGTQTPLAHSHADPKASCGPVSLAFVSRLLGRPGTLEEFNRRTGVGVSGLATMEDLRRASDKSGFAAAGLSLRPDHVPSSKLPMILHVAGQHFLVGIPLAHERWVIVDPPARPRVVSHDVVHPLWEGNAPLLASSEGQLAEILTNLAVNP